MGKHVYNFIINIGLLVAGFATVFKGLLIQVEYHMGNHGNMAINDKVAGLNYSGWTVVHKISIVVFSALVIYHVFRHWKWYKTVILKKLINKNRQVLILSALFILVAITGFIPWLIELMKGNKLIRKDFIEIHDKLALVLSVYLILHILKKWKWLFITFQKMTNNHST